jgi:hypothetical protein
MASTNAMLMLVVVLALTSMAMAFPQFWAKGKIVAESWPLWIVSSVLC